MYCRVSLPGFKFANSFKAGVSPFWALTVFLALAFLTGGGSRTDIQSLVVLHPAAIVFCGIALWTLRWEQVKAHRFLFGMTAAIFALVIIQLVPLPPSVWGALPGREFITQIDKVAGLGDVWRPISMVPAATWNALHSLFVPFAVLLFSVQLDREARFRLLPVVLGMGLFSGFLGILQIVGPPDGPLYFYDITNNGSAVGLFSNRNHQAILLASLFPMLAVYASTNVRSEEQAGLRKGLALAAGTVLIPLMLVTGSRAGLILGTLGILSVFLLYRKPASLTPRKRKRRTIDWRYLLAAFAILCLGALTIILARAEAFQRLFSSTGPKDDRFSWWPHIAEMGWKYFPFGSGFGSFVEVYQIDEPDYLLSPAYANHAHNDWLELFLTGGLPGLILLGLAMIAMIRTSWPIFRTAPREGREIRFARLGAIVILCLALGSIADYPLRSPSLACVFIIATLWLSGNSRDELKNTGSRP
jgi:O-antigen ligase